jgi:hypothetical protein
MIEINHHHGGNMSTPAIRTALVRLIELGDAATAPTSVPIVTKAMWIDAIAAARTALAQLEGEGPSAADLLSANPPNIPTSMAMQYRSAWREGVEDGWNEARAILARWGRPAAPPAPEVGEVAELVAGLSEIAQILRTLQWHHRWVAKLARAATLLQQQESRVAFLRYVLIDCGQAVGGLVNQSCSDSFLLDVATEVRLAIAKPAPAVVPVSERPWDQEGWCDERGHCWRFDPLPDGWWSYGRPTNFMGDNDECWTHMAPHNAIPLPQVGEVA